MNARCYFLLCIAVISSPQTAPEPRQTKQEDILRGWDDIKAFFRLSWKQTMGVYECGLVSKHIFDDEFFQGGGLSCVMYSSFI